MRISAPPGLDEKVAATWKFFVKHKGMVLAQKYDRLCAVPATVNVISVLPV